MTWTAVIPLKGSGERKTRLAGRLDERQRRTLSQQLFSHVASVLSSCAGVSEVVVLSDVRPDNWEGPLTQDEGRGLNIELQAFAKTFGPRRLLIVHADLPLVSAEDIAQLLAEGESGCAIAPDRHGSGTNAIALRDAVGFRFSFGPGSFAHHRAALQGREHVVSRLGLGLDIDTSDDLDAAIGLGALVVSPDDPSGGPLGL